MDEYLDDGSDGSECILVSVDESGSNEKIAKPFDLAWNV